MRNRLFACAAVLALVLGLLPSAAAALPAVGTGASPPAAALAGLGSGVAATAEQARASVRARHLLNTAGLLLIPDWTNDRVMAFDATTGNLVDPNFIPSDPANLASPKHAILSAGGNSILVSDQVRDVVQEYDLSGNFLGTFAPAGGPDPTILDNIRGIALRANGNLLVTVGGGANDDAVAEFDTSGNYLGNFVANGAGGLDSPFAVYGRAGDWLVSASSSSAVHRYDLNGTYIGDLAAINSFPQQIAEAANNNVLVGDFSGTQEGVVELLPDGTLVGIYNPPEVGGNRGAYELPNGNILTTNGSGVHEINRAGNLVETKISGVSAQYIELVQLSVGSDLVLTKTVTPDLVAPGDTVTYTLYFRQAGTYTTTGAIITDVVPISLTNLQYWRSGALITPTGAVSYTWLVEDLSPDEGGTITITGEAVTGLAGGVVFSNTGSITGPELDDDPANNRSTVSVTVLNVPPVAVGDEGSTLQNDSVTIAVLDNDSDPNGDPLVVTMVSPPPNGSTSTDGTWVTYTPTLNFVGTDLFTYTVSDGALSDYAWVTITVIPCDDPTDVDFTWLPALPIVGEVVTFTGSASGTLPLTFTWDLGDGSSAGGITTTHSYTTAGSYRVVLTVTNPCGEAIVTHTVTVVEPCTPVQEASFVWTPPTPSTGEVVTFTGSASGTLPLTFTWDLGDGSTAGGITTTHSYTAAGSYSVVLTVTNPCGEAIVTHTVTVVEPCTPVQEASFVWTPLTPTVGTAVTFAGQATGTLPITYSWDFGDGITTTGATVFHTYTASGTYTVTLVVTNPCGQLTVGQTLTVVPAPTTWKIYLPLVLRSYS